MWPRRLSRLESCAFHRGGPLGLSLHVAQSTDHAVNPNAAHRGRRFATMNRAWLSRRPFAASSTVAVLEATTEVGMIIVVGESIEQ